MRNMKIRMLSEGALLVAMAQLLSLLPLWKMPWGGSIDLAMAPILLFAVRWGVKWGLVEGLAFGTLQMIFEGGVAIGWQSILGDFLAAFTALGLGGLCRGVEKGIFVGTVIGGLARFLVHYVVGATIWAGGVLGHDYDLSLALLLPVQWVLYVHGYHPVSGGLRPAVQAHEEVSHRGGPETRCLIEEKTTSVVGQTWFFLLIGLSAGPTASERGRCASGAFPLLRRGRSHRTPRRS